MQTSLARRRRHRRTGNGRRGSHGGAAATLAIALPLFLFASLAAVGVVGFGGAVAAYSFFADGLEEPKEVLDNLTFTQQTVVVDRTAEVELARLGEQKREVVTFDQLPPELVDATTAVEDFTFWENAGFDPFAIVKAGIDTLTGRGRGASTITQQLVRARLLPASAFEGSVYERKAKEIIQSIRLTQAYPGREGKEQIIAAYLNQNFYGNQSYGVKAAAKSYFGKDLADLSLAEAAILAGIPQSPTAFDLVRNAVEECNVEVAADEECPAKERLLVVPANTEIVKRRNYILELMKTRSVLSGDSHALEEYDAAKTEPVILTPRTQVKWRAPHFVWQVRKELGSILCGPELADACEQVDTGGYRVVTTLDWKMQQSVEKWVYVAARAPNLKNTDKILEARKIPKSEWGWIRNLKDRNIHNAAAGVVDYRTGQVLAYAGSAGYYETGNEKFQPQFDVLSDGYRQPGSSIKPINYSIGIEDRTMTAATMFMDVVTNFTPQAAEPFEPTQADKLERGPVRLRSALQFSLNVPAIKATFVDGLDHVFQRGRDFGLNYLPGAIPVASEGIGTIETRPIDMISAYGTIANGGVRMPRQMLLEVYDSKGQRIWPASDELPAGERVVSPQSAWIMADILAGNTQEKVNPYWAEWQITDGKTRRPAGYKTGTTSDNRDVHAYGFLAPPETLAPPALVAGVWMGNSNNEPNSGSLSLDSSAPLWSAILSEVSKGLPIADFPGAPKGVVQADVDAFSGLLPGPFTSRTVKEWFIDGTVPSRVDDTKVGVEIDEASELLWQEGCVGPVATIGVMDLANVESGFPEWQKANAGWAARAAKGTGVTGGPKKTKTSYFYNGRFAPFGRTWGAGFAPTETCELAPTPPPEPTPCDPLLGECPSPTPVPDGVEVNAFRCLTLDEVTVALSANGLTLASIRPAGTAIDWVVQEQSPAAGEVVPPGTGVDLRFAQRDKVPGCG